jgi:adenylosuccinate synthase
MPALVVVGAQWGDEGKGKLVDYLTSGADWVVRFQGGNNAGHTLVVDGKVFKLHLVPSGILHERAICAIAAGVVVDTQVLLKEMSELEKAGIKVLPERFIIDRDAQIILDYHRVIDQAREEALGSGKIGTTGRGIGPAYEDRAKRSGVCFAELNYLDDLKVKIQNKVKETNLYLEKVLDSKLKVDFESIWEVILNAKEKLSAFVGNVSLSVDKAVKKNQKIVFEGAQGTLLDQIHGTVPFVTSSHTLAGAVTTGVGIGPKVLEHVLGVAKAYTTRVGSGPFPTEIHDQIGDYLVEKGGEFGTTTGRRRRCGWFDIVAMRRSVRLNGIDSLVITKLDVLSGLDSIKLCIKYELDGKEIEDMPNLASELACVKPVYVEYKGWQEDLKGIRKWHDLPAEARLYLNALSEALGCAISIVSVSPDRESTIFSSSSAFVKNFIEK